MENGHGNYWDEDESTYVENQRKGTANQQGWYQQNQYQQNQYQQYQQYQYQQNQQYYSDYSQNNQPEKPKKKSWLTALIAVVAVLALLTVAYFTIHIWTDTSCTQDAVCRICGKTGENSEGHDWERATCTDPKTCSVCGEEKGEPLGHSWGEGSCVEPAVCRECGEKSGEVAGHKWVAASCTAARTCSACGETDGAPMGHSWKGATCTEPKTCTVCGATEGSAMGHDWAPANYTDPKTCRNCGKTDGSPLTKPKVNVEDRVSDIAEVYYDLEEMEDEGLLTKKKVSDGLYYYYDNRGEVHKIVVSKGTPGLGEYSDSYYRSYYFDDGELVFAFFEGNDAHRLYFYNGKLMRWRYKAAGQSNASATNEDYTFSEEFLLWESLALQELKNFKL